MPQRKTIRNADGVACVVCGAERAYMWMYVVGQDGKRQWCCKGSRTAAHAKWKNEVIATNWTAAEQKREAARPKLSVVSPPLALQRARRTPRAGVTPASRAAPAVRSRSPGRVSSRARALSSRDSPKRVPPPRVKRFICDEADASDAGDDAAGGENLDEFEDDGFVVNDHESEPEPVDGEAADDADEGVENDDEHDDDASLHTPLGVAPRACSASRTEVVLSEPREQPLSSGQDAAAQEVTPGTQEEAQEVQQEVWPPCRLPPRLRESPAGVARRAIDFGITCTPQGHKATDRAPNPAQPSDAVRLAAAYAVMRKAARLFRHMHERGILLEAAGGMERGDENGHPHAQIAGRAMSGRSLKYWLEFMRVVFKMCCCRLELNT